MKDKVSIVVSIYNVAIYLSKCIESLINQSYKNIEILLINDGSTDNSKEICEHYKSVDNRIIIHNKTNEGSVNARKDGLSLSSGKYIVFIDGDDWIDTDYISQMIAYIYERDLNVAIDCNFYYSYENRDILTEIATPIGVYKDSELQELKETMIYNGVYYNFGINPALWNKMFKTSVLKEFYKNVPKDISMGDDFCVLMPFLNSCERIDIVKISAHYHYRQRETSMVHSYNSKLLIGANSLKQYLDSTKLRDSRQLQFYYSWIFLIVLKNELKISGSILERIKRIKYVYHTCELSNSIDAIYGLPFKYKLLFGLLKCRMYAVVTALFLLKK